MFLMLGIGVLLGGGLGNYFVSIIYIILEIKGFVDRNMIGLALGETCVASLLQ